MKQLGYSKLMETEWAKQFTRRQLDLIKRGLDSNINVSLYANPIFDAGRMYNIVMGLENGVDASIYAQPEYSSHQMYTLYNALLEGCDVSAYADHRYSPGVMDELKECIKVGIDVSHITPDTPWSDISKLRWSRNETTRLPQTD